MRKRDGIVYKAVMALKSHPPRVSLHRAGKHKAERQDYQAENNSALEFFRNFMTKRKGSIAKNDQFTVKKIYQIYDEWYTTNYGMRYVKSQKRVL